MPQRISFHDPDPQRIPLGQGERGLRVFSYSVQFNLANIYGTSMSICVALRGRAGLEKVGKVYELQSQAT